MQTSAIVLADGYFETPNGKGAHGLVRGSDRFVVTAVVDRKCAGRDAGEVLDGQPRDIPIVESIAAACQVGTVSPDYAVVGIATHGGRFTPELRHMILEAIDAGLGIVNGLHDAASEDPEISQAAARAKVEIIDIRKSKPSKELHFWHGSVAQVKAPRVAVLGTDCALGKRTTTRILCEVLNASGVNAEMIYTGQTGWMQGARHGFVLDSVVNDFVCGELEHAIVECDRERSPQLMLLEGQSSLRNPSGPCGSELLLSGGARGVILQHALGREFFEGYEEERLRIPPVEEEIELIRLYGARTLAITVKNEYGEGHGSRFEHDRERLGANLNLPVVDPVREGVEALVPVLQRFIEQEHSA